MSCSLFCSKHEVCQGAIVLALIESGLISLESGEKMFTLIGGCTFSIQLKKSNKNVASEQIGRGWNGPTQGGAWVH